MALKLGDPFGRLRNNLSKGGAKVINMNVDLEASDAIYQMWTLPTKQVAFEQE